MSNATHNERLPWVAGLLSCFTPSLGHVYLGVASRGIMPLLSVMLLTLVGGWLHIYITFWGFSALIAGYLLLTLWMIVDSVRLARSLNYSYQPKAYNRWYVYLMMFVLINGLWASLFSNRGKWLHYEMYRVNAGSMLPTLHSRDSILVDTRIYQQQTPQRGDVIVFRPPDNPETLFVKRVIAIAGDHVSVNKSGIVYLNRTRVQEPYIFANPLVADDSNPKVKELLIPPASLFVLGDNRNNSKDSRYFGTVALHDVVGKVTYIWMSDEFSRIGSLVQ